ncbi:HAD-superfamily hydrolase, subfamily IA, variant 3 [Penicillium griseofulvum]|uniref:HAD-superfamily hydrolase, subfamily IA, variant 3 n=1 Tax=Penicillium patulum TaxID=5078 RepID=A0A135LJG6_PENPA|nr:HAD-superfamily hydrolase, subfamily IA, variant 3 [Penicillium griseofulvum]KXG49060.1 HAD-superfamily hydrolase, subfamily IA, variant 3 [Penicillium griseofulvum]
MAEIKRPIGLLFDIGGVCVVSPFQAILDYELAQNIPPGWVNFSISRTAPNGSWHKLERGDIKMDANFFAGFNADLRDPELWKQFHQQLQKKKGTSGSTIPPLPTVDAEWLFWEMMRISRTPDRYMYPALKKLRESGQFLMGALSNTVIFPDGHEYNNASEVKQQFDFFISSAHTGLRKPDPKIYQVALQEMDSLAKRRGLAGVNPDDVVFFDDIGENLKGAKKAGMRTVKVTLGKTQDAVKELEKLTGLQLLDEDKARFVLDTPVKMPFTKTVKNNAYFSRFQTKYRRRREGKTDYYARKRLITQAKNKYNAPKYRMVVRFTNRDIVTQIVYSEVTGDKVLAAAYAHELPKYGIEQGLTNWAAAYATGLLLARRVLKKLNLDEQFKGVEEATGEHTLTEAVETDDGERRPFKAFLDVGLVRTSTGNRVFAAMKGASDGGIFIPHSDRRFPGYDIESEELDAEMLKNYIHGSHVSEYMENLADEDEERYKSQFVKYIENEIEAGDLEEIYADAHKAIREDPFKADEDAGSKKTKEEWKAESKKYKVARLTREQRKARVEEKIRKLAA